MSALTVRVLAAGFEQDLGDDEPVRRLKSGDLWDIREVRLWAERTGRSFRE